MANLGRGRVRTRQLSSVLPMYLFSIKLLALAMGEKRKIRRQRRQRKQKGILVQNCTCWERMVPWYLHFCLVSPARLSSRKSPTCLHFVSDHKFSGPCKSEFTFVGPLIIALAGKDASLTSQSTAVS